MPPETVLILIIFLFIYKMKPVEGQDIPHMERPRGSPQGLIKRRRRNQHYTSISGSEFLPNAALSDPISTQSSFPQPLVLSTLTRSSVAHIEQGDKTAVEVTPVGLRSSGVSHRTTGTTIIRGDPAATTTAAPKEISVSRTGKTRKSYETAPTDAGTTSKQGPTFGSSITASITPALSTLPTSPRDNLVDDVDAGVHNFIGSSTSSSASWSVYTVSPSTAPLAKVLNLPSSYAWATSTASMLGSSKTGSDSLLDSSTSGPASARPDKVSYPSNQSTSSSDSSNSTFLGQIMTSSESEFFDLLGLTDKASTGSSTTAHLSPDTSKSSSSDSSPSSIPVELLASTALLLAPTPAPTETSVSGGTLDEYILGVGFLLSADSPEASSTAVSMTAPMLDGNVLSSESNVLIPTLILGDSATAFCPTPAATSGAISIPKTRKSGYTSPIASESDTGPGTCVGTSTCSSVAWAALWEITASVPKSDSPTTSVFLHGSTSDVNITKFRVNTETFQSILATASNSDDTAWMPSTLLFSPDIPAIESSTSVLTEKPQQTPLPGSITLSDVVTKAPSNSILLQLGFDSQLPWPFVATTPLSSSQIFNYTPQAIENALPTHSAKNIAVMFALQPYYNWQTAGYNATLAIFYFPLDNVNTLRGLKVNPTSALYSQSNKNIQSLMAMVDPTIPLEFSGNYPIGGSNSNAGGGGTGSGRNGSPASGNIYSDGSASNFKINAGSIGVVIGAVAGAGAYGAGMFWLARHYRKRKRFHQRSGSSVNHMGQGNSVCGQRADRRVRRGHGRSQKISVPTMAENSLGRD
ncbi:uncharacterized protein N7515_001166 [Penicillium bovifimosum]|uniref:Uncharacterized protein n=1 Tax=Penicillium bovifimosum TaxID=126998 RepID=A0A9W9HGR1_9EURO|nr:uncharacterized protein N7515_001166 [Penicillium bovifimosum]KAJ5146602.1 hypothetical protein N7515_001166 [Penicillium bovifimosum]